MNKMCVNQRRQSTVCEDLRTFVYIELQIPYGYGCFSYKNGVI